MSERSKSFWYAAPADWKPAVGEQVWLNYGHAAAAGTVVAELLPDLFIIEYTYGRVRRRQFGLGDIRPMVKKA